MAQHLDIADPAMYLDQIADAIRARIPHDRLPDGNPDRLFRLYAVLLRAKGTAVTDRDIHDAWAAWMAEQDPNHAALLPFEDLPVDVQVQDRVYTRAVRLAADPSSKGLARLPFPEILFPSGPPTTPTASQQTFDLYKIMVDSSEALVGRRQGVNTFFLTMNGALLTAAGILVQTSGNIRLAGLGLFVLGVAGAVLCGAWHSLIISFGQLNQGKFKVINTIEKHLPASIYAAEWKALGRGEDPRVYRSFTSREIWVPRALLALHLLIGACGLMIATRIIALAART